MKIIKFIVLFLSISCFGQNKPKEIDKEFIFELIDIEIQPEYEGGILGFSRYIGKNFIIPKQAENKNINGKIFVQFVIENDGSLTDVIVLKGLGYGLDEEAIRVVSNCKKWTPGRIKGETIRSKFVIPINLTID